MIDYRLKCSFFEEHQVDFTDVKVVDSILKPKLGAEIDYTNGAFSYESHNALHCLISLP